MSKYDNMTKEELETEALRRQLAETDQEVDITFGSVFGVVWQAAKALFYLWVIAIVASVVFLCVAYVFALLFMVGNEPYQGLVWQWLGN